MDSTLPHGPNLNFTSNTRMAVYPYFAPMLLFDDTSEQKSYLPNSLESVKTSVLTGSFPEYSAHPWGNYFLSKISQNFFPILKPYELPRSLLGDCLFGFKPWTEFESSNLAKDLFESSSIEQNNAIAVLQEPALLGLREWNEKTEQLLQIHQLHQLNSEKDCDLCQRMNNATLIEWWHSTEPIYHKNTKCHCIRCNALAEKGWNMFQEQGGCTCSNCKSKKEITKKNK